MKGTLDHHPRGELDELEYIFPESKKRFTQVAWAQLTQFNKMALMTGLQDSKLDDKTIYFDFDYDTKHDPFWETEFASICHYYIDLIAQTRVFHHYNPTVLQELAYYNDPLELPFKPNWDLQT